MTERIRRAVSFAKKTALVKKQMYPMRVKTCSGFLVAVDNDVDRWAKAVVIAAIFLFRRCSDSA